MDSYSDTVNYYWQEHRKNTSLLGARNVLKIPNYVRLFSTVSKSLWRELYAEVLRFSNYITPDKIIKKISLTKAIFYVFDVSFSLVIDAKQLKRMSAGSFFPVAQK